MTIARTFSTALVFLLFMSAPWAPTPAFSASENAENPWLISVETAITKARAEDQLILVDLYAEWCGWCKTLEDKVFSTPQFKKYTQDFVLLRVDTEDQGEGTLLKHRYGATSLPTTLILDKNMVKVGSVAGFLPTERFLNALQEQAANYRTILTFFEQVLDSDDVELQRKMAADLHDRGDGSRAAELYERILSRVRPGTDAQAWLYYQTADAYRLGHLYNKARNNLGQARSMAKDLADHDLLERIDLLSFQIAKDNGDCKAAVSSLEQFLRKHPESIHQKSARRTLEALQSGEGMQCT